MNKEQIITALSRMSDLPVVAVGSGSVVTSVEVIKARRMSDGRISLITDSTIAKREFKYRKVGANPSFDNWIRGTEILLIAIS